MCSNHNKKSDVWIIVLLILAFVFIQFGIIFHLGSENRRMEAFISDGFGRFYVCGTAKSPEWMKVETLFEYLAGFYCMHPEQLKDIKLPRGCKMFLGFQTKEDEKKIDSWRKQKRFE